MALFELNLAVLRRSDPALAALMEADAGMGDFSLDRAKNGEPIVKRGGIFLHSSYNPSREGAEWAEKGICGEVRAITLLGLGLGYHLKSLAERGFHGSFIEPDIAMFRLALRHLDLTLVLERFRPLVGLSLEILRRVHRNALANEVIPHPASIRANPSYFNPVAEFSRALANVRRGRMKVLLVNPVYGGSLPAAHHSAAALTKLGHEVEVFRSEAFASGQEMAETFNRIDHQKIFRSGIVTLLSEGVELKAKEFQPDLVLALAQAPLHIPALSRLEKSGIPTAFWFVEDYRALPYWRDVAAGYGYFFGIQKGDFSSELAGSGVVRHAYLPTAAAPEVHTPVELSREELEEFGSPLSFVGAGYHNRQRFFRGLLDYRFKIWGSEWTLTPPLGPHIQRKGSRIDTETCVKIFNASSINLNLHSSTCHEGVDPSGDFVNPRTFEIASCGAFQLVDQRSLMGDLFSPGEIETFGSISELREKIDHYLADPDARRAIARRGRARVLAEHTYEGRMEELLALMTIAFPEMAQRHLDRIDRQQLNRAEMEKMPGVSRILYRIPEGRGASLPEIWDVIGEGNGDLSRAEKIFMMLRYIQPPIGNNP